MALDSVLREMAEAIKEFEGWYPPGTPGYPDGSRSFQNNNPGNLKFAGQPGAIGADSEGHAIFSTYDLGWTALIRQLRAAFTGTSAVYDPSMSLYDFFSHYAEENQIPYANFVAGALGVSPADSLLAIVEKKTLRRCPTCQSQETASNKRGSAGQSPRS